MSGKSKGRGDQHDGNARERFVREWRRLVTVLKTECGMGQGQVGTKLNVGRSQMSRYASGQNLPSDQHLHTLCRTINDKCETKVSKAQELELVGLLGKARICPRPERKEEPEAIHQIEAMAGEVIDRPQAPVANPAPPPTTAPVNLVVFIVHPNSKGGTYQGHTAELSPMATSGTASHRRSASRMLAAVLSSAAAFLAAAAITSPRQTDDANTERTQGETSATVNNRQDDCGRFEVAARDLWLRDEYGGPISELTQGQRVSVIRRDSPTGLRYWQISSDDNRVGWTDYRYLRPSCDETQAGS